MRGKEDSSSLAETLQKIHLRTNGNADTGVYEVDWRTQVVLHGTEVSGEGSRAKDPANLPPRIVGHFGASKTLTVISGLQGEVLQRDRPVVHQPLYTGRKISIFLFASRRT